MSFLTSNIRKSAFGDLKVTAGDWTGSAGDANGSLTVEGGRIYFAEFSNQGSSGPTQAEIPWSSTTSGSTQVLSVANREAVTNGRFLVIHA